MRPIIRVENLGKQYRIGERGPTYGSLRESLVRAMAAPLARLRGAARREAPMIWALRDVSFEVMPGEVVGLIGRNGAGKSTLLKILSRITEPTAGSVDLYGRVGSLLEIGTGFHPELTGRENIYLNGAILGMKRREIALKFDEIVAFAEVERFLDTPIKHYSSGMYMRLAFAVAAHLEPEILVVDEVLAVGDAVFQKKCLGKMKQVTHQGRTILFVSHNMAAIVALCNRVALLTEGRLQCAGPADDVIARYYATLPSVADAPMDLTTALRRGTGKASFSSISISPANEPAPLTKVAHKGCSLTIRVTLECRADIADVNVAVIIYDASFGHSIDLNTALKGQFLCLRAGQMAHTIFTLKDLLLKPGRYFVGLWLGRGGIEDIDEIDPAASFDIAQDPQATQHVEVFPGPYQCRFETSTGLSLEQETLSER